MKKFLILLLPLFLVFSCKPPENKMDPELVGTWSDTNSEYTFIDGGNDTLYYGVKHIRLGVIPDTVKTDSSYGTLIVDLKRNNLTFDLKGYITKEGDWIDTTLNSTTWNYEIIDGNLMHYESSTTLGTLDKIR